jgi:uncharacterized linocin/CFP29 family protein
MVNNLGRDRLWTLEAWGDIDKAVKAEVGQIRVIQKVFPSMPFPNGQPVPADKVDLATMTIAEGETKPFIEVSVEFGLTQTQAENESILHTGRTLAKMAAKSLALAEDTLFFQGKKVVPALERKGIKVTNGNSAEDGLLGAAGAIEKIDPNGFPGSIFEGIVKAISELITETQPGPYALFLESSIYAKTYEPLPNTLVTVADRLTPLVTGGYYGTGALPANTGLLVSLGGEPTSIYVDVDTATAFTQEDATGKYRFRVFERVQFVQRDPRALRGLDFG